MGRGRKGGERPGWRGEGGRERPEEREERGESAGKGVGGSDGGAGWKEEGAGGSGGETREERDAESSCVVGEWRGGGDSAEPGPPQQGVMVVQSAVEMLPSPGAPCCQHLAGRDRCCAELQADSKALWLARCSEAGVVLSTQILLASALPLEHLRRGADGQRGGCLSQLSPSPSSLQNLMAFTPPLGKKKKKTTENNKQKKTTTKLISPKLSHQF